MREVEYEPYIVYVRVNEQDFIVEVNSSEFLSDITQWVEIDRGYNIKCHHAQGHYFQKPILTDDGIPRYKLVDGVPVERTDDEIAADIAALPEPAPTETELLQTQIDALTIALLEG